MSRIDLDVVTLKQVNSNLDNDTNALTGTHFPNLKTSLSSISSNVHNSTIHDMLSKISSDVDSISQSINSNFQKVSDFILQQVESYEKSEEEIVGRINNIISKIQEFNNASTTKSVGIFDNVNSSTSGTTAATTVATKTIDPELAKNIDAELGAGFCARVEEVAENVNCDPNDLLALMYSESQLKSTTTNSNGGAVGLNQIMPSTANELGYTTSEIKNMTPIEQLDVVEKYMLESDYYNQGQPKTAGDLYSINFLPGRANQEVLAVAGEDYYNWNSALDVNKDGQITKTELGNRLDNKYAEMEKDFK